MPSARYEQFVHRVWDRLEQLTGHPPSYVDATHIAGRCPVCRDGTILIAFGEQPHPRAFVGSAAIGPGACSRGCLAREIAEALS